MADIELTRKQQLTLETLPRVGAAISLCCSFSVVWTVLRSRYYRSRIYHRIMLGCVLNIIILNITQIWGAAAVPEGTPGFVGARGTIATCSAQGFLHQLMFVVPFYYVALSLLSLAAVQNKFQVHKYIWIEKWIHISVYIFPVCSSAYLLTIDAFNPAVRDCHFAGYPLGCGTKSGTECTRGPQNIDVYQTWLFAAPFLISLMLPALIMTILYIKVRRQPNGEKVANSVAIQSALYLLALYWTYIFRIVHSALVAKLNTFNYTLGILTGLIESLQGLWTLMVYWYFRSEDPMQVNKDLAEQSPAASSQKLRDKKKLGNATEEDRGSSSTVKSKIFSRPECSIFDGTGVADSDSPWAAFLVDVGEDDDYQRTKEYDDTDIQMNET